MDRGGRGSRLTRARQDTSGGGERERFVAEEADYYIVFARDRNQYNVRGGGKLEKKR